MTDENYNRGYQQNGYRSRGHGVGTTSSQTARGQFAHDFHSQNNRRLGKGLEEANRDEREQEEQDLRDQQKQDREKLVTKHQGAEGEPIGSTSATSRHNSAKIRKRASLPLQGMQPTPRWTGMVGMSPMVGLQGMGGMGQ